MPTKPQPVFRTLGVVGGEPEVIDIIEYDDRVWIVAKWSEPLPEGWSRPLRIVCAQELDLRRLLMGNYREGFLLSEPIPTSLFDDVISPEIRAAFEIVDQPPLGCVYL